MTNRRERYLWLAIAIIPLFILGRLAVNTWLEADWTADQSAQAALNKEICDQLAAIQPGHPYPDSLSELDLTYTDGGDISLLSRFDYHSTGKSCTLRTVVWKKEDVRTFPATK
jgi:hypothetical protein